MNTALMVFIRNPVLGRVKTRLAHDLGPDAALALYREGFVPDVLEILDAAGLPVLILYTPADAGAALRQWLGPGRRYLPQRGCDLGESMALAFEDAFGLGFDRAVIVGSDVPGLPSEVPILAAAALEDESCVLGPSPDGGYYLVGFTRQGFTPAVFRGVSWGGREVLAETLSALDKAGLSATLLGSVLDVDTAEDLRLFLAEAPDKAGPRTRRCASSLFIAPEPA